MSGRWLVLVLTILAACGEERIEVRPAGATDYNLRALQKAIDDFVAAGRTPVAYADLSKKVLDLRSGMDRSVAREAELRLVVLALGPIQTVQAKPMAEQVEALALTVWPTLLAPQIEADDVLIKRDTNAVVMYPKVGEDARGYLQRICGGPLAGDCKQLVPEYQGPAISALATRRAMERVRNAVTDCVMCGAEPGWHDAVLQWESLDRQAHGWLPDVERRGAPDNWPIAGTAAESGAALEDPTSLWREAEINALGEVVVGGQRYIGEDRIEALRELRADSQTITLHLRPELTLAQVKGILADASKSGARKVAIVARQPEYPWDRRIYWLSLQGPTRLGLRPTDSLQLLLHTIDHVASPGAVARVD
jgi:hypothetical protein